MPAPPDPAAVAEVAEVAPVRLRRLFARDDGASDDDDEPAGAAATGRATRAGATPDPDVEDLDGGSGEGDDAGPDGAPGEVADHGAGPDVTTEDRAEDADADRAPADEPEEGPGEDEDRAEDEGAEDGFREVDFELSDWGARERKLLDEILEGVRVRRVWQAGTLVVSAHDAAVVDDLIDEIEDRIALDLPAGVDPVVYDVRDWPEGLEDRFVEALIDQRVPHLRGYQEITVAVDDEERVDTLVEEVTSAWEDERPGEGELDGPDAQEVLSELFVSADRLLHDASDKAATVRFDDAAGSATTMALPFGFAPADWEAINAAVAVLRERLGDAEAQDEDIEEAATSLRTLLRPLV